MNETIPTPAPEAPTVEPVRTSPTVAQRAARAPKGERWKHSATAALMRWALTATPTDEEYAAAMLRACGSDAT